MDTLGLVLQAFVTEANYPDREVAGWLIPLLPARFPRLQKLWADGIYQGVAFIQKLYEQSGIRLEIIEREPGTKGFTLLPKRWVVERTFAGFTSEHRLFKDYEVKPRYSVNRVRIAMLKKPSRGGTWYHEDRF